MSISTKIWNAIIIGCMITICITYKLPVVISMIIILQTILSCVFLTQLEEDRV